jgi:hypothetical protein
VHAAQICRLYSYKDDVQVHLLFIGAYNNAALFRKSVNSSTRVRAISAALRHLLSPFCQIPPGSRSRFPQPFP